MTTPAPIRMNEIPQSPRDALELLRRVPDATEISRTAFDRAIEVLEQFIASARTKWVD